MITRRTEIMLKAAKLFHKKGYAATTIRDIAKEMGIESASLYNHISSKEEILKVLLMEMAHRYTSSMKSINESSISSIQKLERIVAEHIRTTIENTDAVSLIPNEWIHLKNENRKEFLDLRNYYDTTFREIFKSCIADGFLKKVNVDISVFSILSTLRRLHAWFEKNTDINPVELEVQLIQNLLGGIKKK